jgi:Sec7-like guanine-nucleotide exchange factor
MACSPLDEPEVTVGEPTEDERQKAQQIFDGNEDFIQKDRAAAWIGEEGLVRQRTLRAYMDLYVFNEKSVLTSLREICGRLVLRAETQQVDRILVTFSKHWCDCNPNHGFKALGMFTY